MSSQTSSPQVREPDMMNMFASVWVKVEVHSDSEQNSQVGSEEEAVDTPKVHPQRKRKWRSNKILKCEQCEYTTTYKNCLDLHILGHNDSKPYSCQLCDYTTKYPTSLHRHVVIKHQIKKEQINGKPIPMHKCDQCDYMTFYKWNLNGHKRKHKLEKQYKCPQCPFATAYKHNYLKHSKIHSEDVFFKCDKCPFITKFEGHITRHLAKIHNEITEKANKCEFCDFSTKLGWRLNIHKQRSQKKSPIKCLYCDFETYYNCEHKAHKMTHFSEMCKKINNTVNSDQNEAIEIEKTQEMDTTDQEINATHQQIETTHQQFDTTHQDKQNNLIERSIPPDATYYEKGKNRYLIDPDCVDFHSIEVLESEDKDRPFQCHMCAYTSKFKASVQRHFQRHHTGSQNRPYKCCHCDFSTKTKDQIALHNKRSLSEAPLHCTACDFSTVYKCQYVVHQKCHYAYKCTSCEYSCKHKYELQKHYAMHLGNGLKCRFCDYKAMRKDSLLCHETLHTGIKPFKCNYCEYTSVRKSLLDNHLKRYHSDVKQDLKIVSQSKIESLKIPLTKEQINDLKMYR